MSNFVKWPSVRGRFGTTTVFAVVTEPRTNDNCYVDASVSIDMSGYDNEMSFCDNEDHDEIEVRSVVQLGQIDKLIPDWNAGVEDLSDAGRRLVEILSADGEVSIETMTRIGE